MKQHDWLFNYSTLAGMKHSFEGLVRRAKYLDNSDSAYRLMIENFSQLQDCYDHFFPEITEYVSHQLEKMNVAN